METQIKDLIEKIKAEGIEQAQERADALLAEAKVRAEAMIADAQSRAEATLSEAKREIARLEASSQDAIKHVARDVVLSLRSRIQELLDGLTKETVDAAMTQDLVEKLLLALVPSWASEGDRGIQVVLGSKHGEAFAQSLKASLTKKLKGGFEIRLSDRFAKGLRVNAHGSALTVDMSAPAIAELLSEAVSPTVSKLLKDAHT